MLQTIERVSLNGALEKPDFNLAPDLKCVQLPNLTRHGVLKTEYGKEGEGF